MVVFIVFNSPLDGLDAEAKGRLHLHNEFVVDGSRHRVVFVVLILGLVEAIPRVLFQAFDAYTLSRVRHEDF